MRALTDGADDPVFRSPSAEISFNMFQPVQAEERHLPRLFPITSAV